jgi:hypothetical protein
MPVSTIPGAGITSSTTLTTPIVATTMGVGGATPSASGSGITFPATQSASTDANTLDDYEEGTWAGTLKGSVSDPTTPVTATGSYTKIGRQVFARILFNAVTTTGASGSLSVLGLPFSSSAVDAIATGSVMLYDIATNFSGANNVSPYIAGSSTSIFFYSMVNAGIWTIVNHNPGTTRYLIVSVTYEV